MKRKIYQIDAFTDKAFCGNPAGVMIDATGLTDTQMMKIAAEMKLSETAFVFPGGPGYDFEVKFFTPTDEVDLCGHATIGTFSLLNELGILDKTKTEFVQKTKAGLLDIKIINGKSVLMRQTAPLNIKDEIPLYDLCEAMNISKSKIGFKDIMKLPEIWSTGLPDILLPVATLDDLKKMSPNMNLLTDFSNQMKVIGVHAFCIDENNQLWCRNFAPACGIPEESATGTSNGALGACLYSKGWNIKEDNTLSFTANQGDWMNSPSRISVLVKGNDKPEVWVGGNAVTVIDGEIVLPE